MDDLQDLVAHCKSQHSDVSGNFSFRNSVMTKNICTNRPRARYDPRAPPPPHLSEAIFLRMDKLGSSCKHMIRAI